MRYMQTLASQETCGKRPRNWIYQHFTCTSSCECLNSLFLSRSPRILSKHISVYSPADPRFLARLQGRESEPSVKRPPELVTSGSCDMIKNDRSHLLNPHLQQIALSDKDSEQQIQQYTYPTKILPKKQTRSHLHMATDTVSRQNTPKIAADTHLSHSEHDRILLSRQRLDRGPNQHR